MIIGHSHVECLRLASKTDPDKQDIPIINLNKIHKDLKNKNQTVPEYVNEVIKAFEPSVICACLKGNYHNVIGLLENPIPFSIGEKLRGSTSPSAADRMFIPLALMEEYFERQLQKTFLHTIYQSAPDARRLYLNPPPPISDFSHIQKHPGVFADKLEMGPAPNELKAQLYKLQSNALRNLAEQEDATFIDVEPALVDAEGFLAADYFHRDPTHGNAAYGKVMLEKIIKLSESAR